MRKGMFLILTAPLASFFSNVNVRLGILHMQAGEALHGICLPNATRFPMAIALAGTWDPDIIEKMAAGFLEKNTMLYSGLPP